MRLARRCSADPLVTEVIDGDLAACGGFSQRVPESDHNKIVNDGFVHFDFERMFRVNRHC